MLVVLLILEIGFLLNSIFDHIDEYQQEKFDRECDISEDDEQR